MTDAAISAERGPRRRSPVPLAAFILILVTALGVVAVFRYVAAERERDMQDWQVRMGIIADGRFAAVNDWLERRFGVLTDLARNASLQLYLTQIELAGGIENADGEMPEVGYLRNLLVATADSGGFTAPIHGPKINANVARIGIAGIALLDMRGRVMVATPAMPPIDERLVGLIRENPGRRFIDDLRPGPDGEPVMTFAVPVYAVQSAGAASDQVGVAVGMTLVNGLYPRLVQPGATTASAEAVLVRADGASIDYLSPLADGTAPFTRTLALDTPDLAAAFAIATPGGFTVARDYANAEVLVTARRFEIVPWTLMYKVSTDEALADTDAIGMRITVREARWMWHVHQAVDGAVHLLPGPVPEPLFSGTPRPMPWEEFEVISLTLARAEEGRDVLGQEFDVSDVEHYVAYRPWSGDQAWARYQEAIALGIVRAWDRDYQAWRQMAVMPKATA